MNLDMGSRITILVHYYRAMVGRADNWRLRMDTTTNWAIGATAALISFSLGTSEIPHYVVFLSSFLTFIFLLLEARRLTFYHLWQQRVLLLEEHLVSPALSNGTTGDGEVTLENLRQELQPHLGRTVPTMSLRKAMSRRLRRVYVYLFVAQILAWLLKLSIHPEAAASWQEWTTRAEIGLVTGPVVLASIAAILLLGAVLAVFEGGPWTTDRTPL